MKCAILLLNVLSFILIPSLLQAQPVGDADFDGNGQVAFADFIAFAGAFGSTESKFDLNENGAVDFPDFLIFVQLFREANPSPAPLQETESEPASPPASALKQVLLVDTPGNTRHILLLVPEGEFTMGFERLDNSGLPSGPRPVHTVFLNNYYIDQFEVTNEQFVAFLNSIGTNLDQEYDLSTPLIPGG